VRALHREWGFTALQVTHDFTEAGLLGDVAVLLDAGRVLQFGPPEQVFRKPASPYIAEFLGAENVFAGTARVLAEAAPDWLEGDPASIAHGNHAIEFTSGPLTLYTVGSAGDGPCYAVIRSEEVTLSLAPQATSARNEFRGRVVEVGTLGAFARVTLDVDAAGRRGHDAVGAGDGFARGEPGVRDVQGVRRAFVLIWLEVARLFMREGP
jgi:ABC-type Fe3+/spermidine/putrescine transport system ATPase subunit